MKYIYFPLLISTLLLSSCAYFSQEQGAPVVDLDLKSQWAAKGIHLVSSGETLYEIAFQYGKDYRELAEINAIHSPYTIYPGQKLKLQGSKIKSVLPKKSAPIVVTPIHHGWAWPVKGTILRSFSLRGNAANKGIDIAGQLGTSIRAASGGNVVYAGMGLRGYGQLIILKHNDTYLSAYAHNNKLLVKEGDIVQKGDIIAQMGQTESDRVKLHFEIRRNGQPIDPISVLPAK